MAGEAGAVAARMMLLGEGLATVTERDGAALAKLDPPTDAAGVEKSAKACRAVALAGRSVIALVADAVRLHDGAETSGDEDGEADDGEEEERDPEGLQRLRDELKRKCAAWDARNAARSADRQPAATEGGPGVEGLAPAGPSRPAPA